MHYIRKYLIYLTRKAFLEQTVVELVNKFVEKSYCDCLKSESIAKVRFKYFFVHKHIYLSTYIYMDTSPDHIYPARTAHAG